MSKSPDNERIPEEDRAETTTEASEEPATMTVKEVGEQALDPDQQQLAGPSLFSPLKSSQRKWRQWIDREVIPPGSRWTQLLYLAVGIVLVGLLEGLTRWPSQALLGLVADIEALSIVAEELGPATSQRIARGLVVTVGGATLGWLAYAVVWLKRPLIVASNFLTLTQGNRGRDDPEIMAAITTSTNPEKIADVYRTAHDGYLQLSSPEVTDGVLATLPALKDDEETELLTLQVEIRQERPGDVLQQGLTVDEAMAAGDDRGVPSDEIASIIANAEYPIEVTNIVKAWPGGADARDAYATQLATAPEHSRLGVWLRKWLLAQPENDGDSTGDATLPEAAVERRKNLQAATDETFIVALRALVAIPKDAPAAHRREAIADLKRIASAVDEILPPYCEAVPKIGSTTTQWPLARWRARQTIRDIRNQRIRTGRPGRIRGALGWPVSQPYLAMDSDEIWTVLSIPGSGRPATARGFEVSPREQWPTQRPNPSSQESLRGDYPDVADVHGQDQDQDEDDDNKRTPAGSD